MRGLGLAIKVFGLLLVLGLCLLGSVWPWNFGSLILFGVGMAYAGVCSANQVRLSGRLAH